jgi:lysine 6-dehydrogenase
VLGGGGGGGGGRPPPPPTTPAPRFIEMICRRRGVILEIKLLILGSGLMGPAAAYNGMADPDVSQVVVCDVDGGQLDRCRAKLAGLAGAAKLSTVRLDLEDRAAAVALMSGFDAAVAALPNSMSLLALEVALQAGTPLVDLARPDAAHLPALRREAEAAGRCIILGCGVEPGLTEIMALYLARKLDRVDELHIKCGGIPEQPTPPLGYKIVFGGRRLPLRESDGLLVRDGQLEPVARYSGVEPVTFPGVGECEAWHEGFVPWLLELPELEHLRIGTQKTVRWPGYAAKVTILKEMGLLSQEPVDVEGVQVAPKQLLDAVLYPRVRLAEDERDITVFRVEAVGEKAGRPRKYRVEMVDRYDEATGFTSMARTTAFTGAIVARMIGRGNLQANGALSPEKVITGPLFDRLVAELAAVGVRFDVTMEKIEALDGGLRSNNLS